MAYHHGKILQSDLVPRKNGYSRTHVTIGKSEDSLFSFLQVTNPIPIISEIGLAVCQIEPKPRLKYRYQSVDII